MGGTLAYIRRWRPKRILLENVIGLVRGVRSSSNPGMTNWGAVRSALVSLGYACGYHCVNSKDSMLPQRRLRVYVWAELGEDDEKAAAAWWSGFLEVAKSSEPVPLEQLLTAS